MLDDRTLLRNYAADRTESAFAELVRRHVDGVYSAALRRVGGDTHLAQDVTQQVFIALARKAAAVAHHPILTGWLFVATRHAAANAVRSEQRRRAREQEAEAMRDSVSDSEPVADWSQLAPVLEQTLDELNERDRTAILLRFVDRKTFPDLAAVLQLSDDAARMRVERALDRLRGRLARRGITSTAAALGVVLANHAVTAAPVGLAGAITAAAAATAPAAALSAASIFEIMSTTKAMAGAVTLVVIGAVGTTTNEVLNLRAAEAARLEAARSSQRLAANVQKLEARLAATAAETADLENALAAARTARRAEDERLARARTNVAATVSGPATPEMIAAGQALLERDPELKRAVVEYCRSQFGSAWDALYRARQFTPAQIEQFERVMMMGSGVLRRVTGPNGEPVVIAGPGFGNAERKREAEQGLMWLGPEGGKQLRELMTEDRSRTLTVQIAGALAFSPTPLTTEQAREFTRIVVACGGRSGTGTYAWEPILAQAKELLAEPQLAVVRGLQAQEQYQLAMTQALRGSAKR